MKACAEALPGYGTADVVTMTLDAVPDGWAKIDGRWVRLVKHDADDGDLISDYFTEED